MTRTYRYRLTPSRAQAATLLSWLKLTREIYNAALQERRDAWAKQGVSVSRYDQQAQIKDVRVDRPDVAMVPVTALRGAVHRLDKAFAAFFRRCKAGEKPGYPRFKGARRWNTVEFDNPLDGSYDTICVEKLNVKGLAGGMLAKSVHDAGWGILGHWLRVKAEEAGRAIIEVNPAGTSQTCSNCGVIGEHKSLAVRVHRCADCGYTADRDVNAAINIKALGMRAQGEARAVGRPRRSAKCATAAHRPRHGRLVGVSSA